MKDIDEMTDTIELLKKGIKKQLESAIVTLQLIHQDKLFKYLNFLDGLIDYIS